MDGASTSTTTRIETPSRRRTGDTTVIGGDYQYRALTAGPAPQRFWHATKLWLVDRYLAPRASDRVLDVGCGSGVVAAHIADRPVRECVAIDGNPSAIAFGRNQFARPNLRFIQSLVDELDMPPASFDSACCLELIEHIYPEQGEALLRSLHRLVRPGGLLLLTTPNMRSAWPLIEWGLDRSGKVPRLAGEQHVAFYTHGRLARLARAAGWRTLEARSCCTVAPWSAWASERLARYIRERETRLPFGTILVHVLERPGESGACS